MGRCQHCNKLTHSEDLIVEYLPEDQEKVDELRNSENWVSTYNYTNPSAYPPNEYGKLKVGDIWIHFRYKKSEECQ